MTETRKLLKIGVFAKHANTNLRALRYYEGVGLLSPAACSQGGIRYYRREDLNRITLIRNLQKLGLTLDEIQIAKLDSATEKLKECEVTPGPHNNHCEPCEKPGKCLPEVLSGLF